MVTIKNLSIGYENKRIVSNLNFKINQGDYICIIGPNGAGKSTFVKTLLGLKKELSGEIIFDSSLKRTEIGYLPQVKSIQSDFPASVYEVVLSGCLNKLGFKPFYGKKYKTRVNDVLKRLNIVKLKDKCFSELSGGEQQKVLLARAMCATDKIIVLDEPVTGLDPKSTNDLYKKISELNRKDKLTVIMVTHDVDTSLEYATHILNINGKHTFYGTAHEYLHGENCTCVEGDEFHDTSF